MLLPLTAVILGAAKRCQVAPLPNFDSYRSVFVSGFSDSLSCHAGEAARVRRGPLAWVSAAWLNTTGSTSNLLTPEKFPLASYVDRVCYSTVTLAASVIVEEYEPLLLTALTVTVMLF